MEEVLPSVAKCNAIYAVSSIFLVLSWVAVSLRVYVRGFMIKAFGLDDWLMLITLAFFTIDLSFLMLISWIEVNKGLQELEWLSKVILDVIIQAAFYICTSMFLKLSLAVFLLRVVVERWQRWVIYISVTVYTIYTVNYLFVAVFQCGNPANYIQDEVEGKCIAWNILLALNYVHSTLNALVDWVFALLPFFVLRNANMPRRAKLTVFFLMALGALGSVASVVRLGFISGLAPQSNKFFDNSVNIALTSVIEPGLGIIAGSMATLRPLVRTILDRTRISEPSEEGTPRPPNAGSSAEGKDGQKQLGSFASYGYSEDPGKSEVLTLITATGSSTFGAGEEMEMEETCPAVEVPSPCEAYTPSWVRVSYSTMSGPRKESSASSRIGPMTAHTRKLSLTSINHRKPSEAWIASNPQRETWGGYDLEAAKRNWQIRSMDHRGDVRILPNLLLPDVDAEDHVVGV